MPSPHSACRRQTVQCIFSNGGDSWRDSWQSRETDRQLAALARRARLSARMVCAPQAKFGRRCRLNRHTALVSPCADRISALAKQGTSPSVKMQNAGFLCNVRTGLWNATKPRPRWPVRIPQPWRTGALGRSICCIQGPEETRSCGTCVCLTVFPGSNRRQVEDSSCPVSPKCMTRESGWTLWEARRLRKQ